MSTPTLVKSPRLALAHPTAVLTIVSLAHAVNHAYSTLMPLVYPLVVAEFRLSYSEIGIMVGVASAASGLLQMAFSYLSRYIPRRILLGGGQVVIAASTAASGIANGFGLFFLGNLFARIGGSPQHPVGNTILSDRFETKRRGFALSMHVSGGNVGTVVVPIIGTFLIGSLGWRVTLFIFAAAALVVGLMLVLLLNDSTPTMEGETHPSRDTGNIRTILSNRNIQLIFLASTIAAGGRGLGVLITYVPLYLQNALKLDPTTAGILFTLLLIGSVAGPVLFGRISDTRGRRSILVLIYAAATLTNIIFVYVGGTIWLLALVLVAMGIVVYAESPLLQTFLADSTLGMDRDLAFGLYFTIVFGVGAFWTSVLGWVIDNYGFVTGFHVMALSYVVAALVLLPTREVTEE